MGKNNRYKKLEKLMYDYKCGGVSNDEIKSRLNEMGLDFIVMKHTKDEYILMYFDTKDNKRTYSINKR
jgi:hypothetical protein